MFLPNPYLHQQQGRAASYGSSFCTTEATLSIPSELLSAISSRKTSNVLMDYDPKSQHGCNTRNGLPLLLIRVKTTEVSVGFRCIQGIVNVLSSLESKSSLVVSAVRSSSKRTTSSYSRSVCQCRGYPYIFPLASRPCE